jgi:nucleotide-binding universal stress UspA family protein
LNLLAKMARQVEEHGVPCTTILKHGLPQDVIEEAIEDKEARRLIMGSHGRGKLGRLTLGSVANQLLGHVAVPVFLVGPHCSNCPDRTQPKRILHPVSMNGEYRRSVEIAVQLAQMYDAEVTMLHIGDRETERAFNTSLALSWAERIFAELNPDDGRPRPKIKVSVAFGEPVTEIRQEANRIKADWIVLGVDEGQNLWPLLETTAYRTLAVVDCPVFAFRHMGPKAKKHHQMEEIAMSLG